MHLEAFALGVVGEGRPRVRTNQAPRGFDVRVDINGLVEVEATIDAPVEGMDDVVGVLGAKSAEDNATITQ